MSVLRTGVITSILFATTGIMSSCTRANAGNMKSDLRNWVSNLLTPRNTTLEKAVTGYSLKGSIKNKPRQLITLYEMQSDKLVMLDTVTSDAAGNFELSGNVK